MTTLEIMDARGYSLPLEGNLCFVLIIVVYSVNSLAGTDGYNFIHCQVS